MSQNIVVIQFDDAAEASAALQAIRDQHKENQIHLNDTAIIRKDAEGKIHKVNEVSSATEVGAVAGGTLGLLLMFLFPIAGIAIGAASGAAIGAAAGQGRRRQVGQGGHRESEAWHLGAVPGVRSAHAVGDARPGAVSGPPAPDDPARRHRAPAASGAARQRGVKLGLSSGAIFPN